MVALLISKQANVNLGNKVRGRTRTHARAGDAAAARSVGLTGCAVFGKCMRCVLCVYAALVGGIDCPVGGGMHMNKGDETRLSVSEDFNEKLSFRRSGFQMWCTRVVLFVNGLANCDPLPPLPPFISEWTDPSASGGPGGSCWNRRHPGQTGGICLRSFTGKTSAALPL